jgi:hypothetical protein
MFAITQVKAKGEAVVGNASSGCERGMILRLHRQSKDNAPLRDAPLPSHLIWLAMVVDLPSWIKRFAHS